MKIIKRIVKLFVITAFALVMTLPVTLTSNAAAPVLQATGRVNSDIGAIVRQSPSTSSKKITALKNNTMITITGEVFISKTETKSTSIWYAVKYGKVSGYMRSDLVKNVKYNPRKATATDELYYRVGPAKTMVRKGMFKKGSSINAVMQAKVNGSNQTWYKVKVGNNYYYSCGDWISFSNSSKSNKSKTASTSKSAVAKATSKKTTEKKQENIKITNKISNATYPSKIGQGSPFSIRGEVTSSGTIKKAVVSIVDTSGKTRIKAEQNVNGKKFNIASVDAKIKFGTLPIGNYKYKVAVQVGSKTYTVADRAFSVVRTKKAEAISNFAWQIAWPQGTSAANYGYNRGRPTDKYKAALNKAYPDRSRWGSATRVGASCDVFVGTVLRASGVDTTAPRGLDEQFEYFPKSKKWTRISYNGDTSILRSGDVILYKNKNSNSAHACIYVKRGNTSYIAEASYSDAYGKITSGSEVWNRLKTSSRKKVEVYRIVE